MHLNIRIATLIAVSAAIIFYGRMVERGSAEPPPASALAQGPAGTGTAAADFPRGAEQIYMIKCWMCHNEFAKTGPPLKDIAKRPKLISGQPVNDRTVSEVIRNGSQRMPSYRYSLSDRQLAELVGYILTGKCCPDPDNPPSNAWYQASATNAPAVAPVKGNLKGGPRGVVRSAGGEPLEGIMVQLESQAKSIKTTVYSSEDGRYEFPQLESGAYALRVAKPLEFRAYEKDGIRIDGTTMLPEIVLERVTDSEFLPPTPDIAVQLTGAEWLTNITGTADEKKTLANTCGGGCHSYRQIFRNRYDEHSWQLIVDRMLGTAAALLINPQPNNRHRFVHNEEEVDQIVKWLAKVRGPDAQDAPFKVFPRPRGLATRVIVTEYALPHLWCYSHDVAGDSKGNIWYTCHRSSYVGRLEPRTGVINEFKLPSTPGAYPGTHWVSIDKNDVAWFSENWSHKITKFDPKTEKFTSVHVADEGVPLNSAGVGNMALAPDGTVWDARGGFINQINPQTGEYLKRYPLKKVKSTYGSDMSWDGSSWAGGASPADFAVFLDIKTGEVRELPCPTPNCNPARGGFDPQGNAWFGGRGGPLLKVDGKTHRFTEYYPPTPYVTFYEAKPDKNGEVWAGELHGGRIARFNPKLERWVEYVLPEAEVHDRRIWIDNSTSPVTVWYIDHNERIVRIQPLD